MTQNGIDASVSYASFQSEGAGFVEIYLNVLGRSTGLVPVTDSTKQARVDVVILFKQGENVVKFDKYRLNGPASASPIDFVDVKRYGLPNGEYELEVSVEDIVNTGNAHKYHSTFTLNFEQDKLAISDIELLASVKNAPPGASSTNPMVKGNFIFQINLNRINFYCISQIF